MEKRAPRRNLLGLETELIREEEMLQEMENTVDTDKRENIVFCPPLISKEAERLNIFEQDIAIKLEQQIMRATRVFGVSIEEGKVLIQQIEKQNNDIKLLNDPKFTVDFTSDFSGFMSTYLKSDQSEFNINLMFPSSSSSSAEACSHYSIDSNLDDDGEFSLEETAMDMKTLREKQLYAATRKSVNSRHWNRRISSLLGSGKMSIYQGIKLEERFRALQMNNLDVLIPSDVTTVRPPFLLDIYEMSGSNAFEYQRFYDNLLTEDFVQFRNVMYSSIIFRLPCVLQDLAETSVINYLKEYCSILNGRQYVYIKIFTDIDVKARRDTVNTMRESAKKLLLGHISESELNEFISLISVPEGYVLQVEEFIKCLALCDRLYTANSEGIGPERWNYQADILERIDFQHIEEKILQCTCLKPDLARLLITLANRTKKDFDFAKHLANRNCTGTEETIQFGKIKKQI